jgi:hypothetical protein
VAAAVVALSEGGLLSEHDAAVNAARLDAERALAMGAQQAHPA